MADAKTITVKLILDTTEFDAALERVVAALAELGSTLRPHLVVDNAHAGEARKIGQGKYNPVTGLHEWYAEDAADIGATPGNPRYATS